MFRRLFEHLNSEISSIGASGWDSWRIPRRKPCNFFSHPGNVGNNQVELRISQVTKQKTAFDRYFVGYAIGLSVAHGQFASLLHNINRGDSARTGKRRRNRNGADTTTQVENSLVLNRGSCVEKDVGSRVRYKYFWRSLKRQRVTAKIKLD